MKARDCIVAAALAVVATAGADECLTAYVDPFIGTEGTANCFPNACVPFGLVQNGPCSGTYEWKYCGGYHFEDKMLYGFVLKHADVMRGGELVFEMSSR